jgi:hypothetical protein
MTVGNCSRICRLQINALEGGWKEAGIEFGDGPPKFPQRTSLYVSRNLNLYSSNVRKSASNLN